MVNLSDLSTRASEPQEKALIKMADSFDKIGEHELANDIDKIANIGASIFQAIGKGLKEITNKGIGWIRNKINQDPQVRKLYDQALQESQQINGLLKGFRFNELAKAMSSFPSTLQQLEQAFKADAYSQQQSNQQQQQSNQQYYIKDQSGQFIPAQQPATPQAVAPAAAASLINEYIKKVSETVDKMVNRGYVKEVKALIKYRDNILKGL